MKQHRQHAEENSAIGIESIAHICAELSIDDGVWLEMENNLRSPAITQKLCKNSRVSLNVTPEDLE